ncbi:MAG: GntR family transcriptional regulator [Lachnospira sp.]|nr:GntR family transcriptional regulator [Lachnospira sp.]
MIHVDFRDAHPIYEQVKEQFRRLIVQEVLSVDEKLPSVRELAAALAINPNTIQRAYRDLEQEGYVYTIAGKGSFVAGSPTLNEKQQQELLKKLSMVLEECYYGKIAKKVVEQQVDDCYKQEKKGESVSDKG